MGWPSAVRTPGPDVIVVFGTVVSIVAPPGSVQLAARPVGSGAPLVNSSKAASAAA